MRLGWLVVFIAIALSASTAQADTLEGGVRQMHDVSAQGKPLHASGMFLQQEANNSQYEDPYYLVWAGPVMSARGQPAMNMGPKSVWGGLGTFYNASPVVSTGVKRLAWVPEVLQDELQPREPGWEPRSIKLDLNSLCRTSCSTAEATNPLLEHIDWTNWYRQVGRAVFDSFNRRVHVPCEVFLHVYVIDSGGVRAELMEAHDGDGVRVHDSPIVRQSMLAATDLAGQPVLQFPDRTQRQYAAFSLMLRKSIDGSDGYDPGTCSFIENYLPPAR